jgi:hypothetical protein
MKEKTYTIVCNSQMTLDDWMNELEALTAAGHKLMEVGLMLGKAANEPDFQSLTAAAGNANVALHYARAIASGQIPGAPSSGQTPPRIQ